MLVYRNILSLNLNPRGVFLKVRICFLTLFFSLFFLVPQFSLALDRLETITTEEMKRLHDERAAGKIDFILVNTLDEIVYRNSSIPGSVNIPWHRTDDLQDRLGKIKNIPIITYCEGASGVSAYKAAVAIKKLGYKDIKIYSGGLEEWKKAGHNLAAASPLPEYEVQFISPEDLLKDLLKADSKGCVDWRNNPLITILDLRTENFLDQKFPIFHIKTACQTIKMLFDQLSDKNKRNKIPIKGQVVTVTERGERDADVIRYLYTHGYTNVVGLSSGIQGWIQLDYSLKSRK